MLHDLLATSASSPQAITTPALLWLPLLPLFAFIILIFFGRRLGRLSAWVAIGALGGACALAGSMGAAVLDGQRLTVAWRWLSVTDARWTMGLSVDGLTWLMLMIVTSIGTMIALYSIGYMHDDPRVSRFFAYLSLFCASMLGLVLADHFVLLYACWELVGLCSYLLISFWFEKPAAAAAGRKAFLTTRIGDTGLLLGIFLLAAYAGELRFPELASVRALIPEHLLTLISVLVFFGAVGKSAQVPLHVWLPDAMEGPTPVSALIHAATMVAAGVYLVARTAILFTPASWQVVLTIGLLTHLFAGTVALTQTDLKRILAYSTISQLGLMMTALGMGAITAAMFHLLTHAFFKALLFLAAGSVIHATHQQELSRLGGLWRRMPWTHAVCLIASLSMGGFLFLSGFWSKDAILLAAQHAHPWLLWVLLLGATMTAGYIARLYLRCFHGAAPHDATHHPPHESPPIMVAPMVILAIGAAFVGFVGLPAHEGLDLGIAFWSSAALAVGAGLAWLIGFQRRQVLPSSLRSLGHRLYTLAANTFYVDELYARTIIRPLLMATAALSRYDLRVIDGAVNAAGQAGWVLSQWKERFDRFVVDWIVNGIARAIRGVGMSLRWIQTGLIHHYLITVVVAVAVLSMILRR